MTVYSVIGKAASRADGPDKVTGKAIYTADVLLPDALWGKVLRSPFPHALITSIDISKAQDMPGIYSVLTGSDVKGVLYGRRLRDIPVLAQGQVRFIGEPVAAVAAIDADTAEQALNSISIEYAELPGVFDAEDALRDNAPILHPEVNNYIGLPLPSQHPSNQFASNVSKKGSLDIGFAKADLILEETFTTHSVHQAYLETNSCMVWIDDQKRIQVWASNKSPYALRQQLSDALGIPTDQIVLNPAYIGGDFGGKGSPINVPLCYFLALHSNRPVKMVMDYVEEFTAANPRHPSVIRLKTGVKTDGSITAHQGSIILNSGAYGGYKPLVNLLGATRAADPYKIPNIYVEAVQVYTNTVPKGHMRSPGEPQGTFALESHLDSIARKLGMNPFQFRLINLIQDGDETASGVLYQDVRAKETLTAAIEAAKYHSTKGPNIGRGMAMGDRSPGGGETHVEVELSTNGRVVLRTPIFEQGTGTHTSLKQIVAEELTVPMDQIDIEVWNTDAVSFDAGVGGSRVTRIASQAAYQATRQARERLFALASELLGWNESQITQRDDQLLNDSTGEIRRWEHILAEGNHTISGFASILDREHSPVTSFTAQVAEVSVDPTTGEVKILNFTTAHDVGKILNPTGHQGQIYGGIIQGIGYALMEDLKIESGQVHAVTFGDYKIPTMMDIPAIQTVLLESDIGIGPYNIKGIGENSIVPVAAAIANAVEDAVGVRIRDLPITPEKIYTALKNHQQRNI